MNVCPACNKKIGLAGLEPTGRYANNKSWYQLAEKEVRCPHCKVVLSEVSTRPLWGGFGIAVLVLANLALAIFGAQGGYRIPVILTCILGFILLAYYLRGFRIADKKEH